MKKEPCISYVRLRQDHLTHEAAVELDSPLSSPTPAVFQENCSMEEVAVDQPLDYGTNKVWSSIPAVTTASSAVGEEESTHIGDKSRCCCCCGAVVRERACNSVRHLRQKFLQCYWQCRRHPSRSAHRFVAMIRQYGPIFVVTYLAIYVVSLLLLFLGIEIGFLDPVKLFHWMGLHKKQQDDQDHDEDAATTTVELVVNWMERHDWSACAKYVGNNVTLANFVVAWIAVKFTEPVRLGLTLAVVPRVRRYWQRNRNAVVRAAESGSEDDEVQSSYV